MVRQSLINEATAALAKFRNYLHVHGDKDVPDEINDSALHAQGLAHSLGLSDARQVYARPHESISAPFSDESLAADYLMAFLGEVESLSFAARYPSNPQGHTLYCPRGCNALHTTSGYSECAACGCVMSSEARDLFEDSLEAAGQLM